VGGPARRSGRIGARGLAPVDSAACCSRSRSSIRSGVGGRIDTLTEVLTRFRARPGTLARCFATAVFVQGTMVLFYFAVTYALHLNVALSDIAVIVPISFVVQMLPVSFGGFGVREATFSIYFSRIGQPIESAIAMSLIGQALIILFSLTGAAVYISRRKH
jgi:uncharacterized membrane protein YbhN (UPF0104 family)